jgi:hypothetical protein
MTPTTLEGSRLSPPKNRPRFLDRDLRSAPARYSQVAVYRPLQGNPRLMPDILTQPSSVIFLLEKLRPRPLGNFPQFP